MTYLRKAKGCFFCGKPKFLFLFFSLIFIISYALTLNLIAKIAYSIGNW